MSKSKACAIAVIVIAMQLGGLLDGQSSTRKQRELRMADQAILASLAVSQSPKGKKLCINSQLACVGPDKAELGLALIGARATKEARSQLVDLLAYRLDGSVAEDFQCYVLNAGVVVKGDLLNINPGRLRDRCHDALQKLIRPRRVSFEGLDENAICADPNAIRSNIKELLKGIKRGVKGSDEDF